ncbi:alanine racemase [Sorangium sp. So ce367]|uniref:alanine racemase n=1 Tax=Sorangium sp. So ce367 TaxID=3133305 RepID=UPI003F62DDEB
MDLDAIAHNLGVIRAAAPRAKVLAVVKADAYRHGAVQVASRLEREGVHGFGVALTEEGIELREAGIRKPIVVLNGVHGGAHRDVLRAGLTPVIYDIEELESFHRASGGAPFAVHLKVDTGMARLGIPVHELCGFLARAASFPLARIEGLMTHLARADDDPKATHEQLERMAEARRIVAARGHRPSTVHVANSAGVFGYAAAQLDMVRPGIALYGVAPAPGTGGGLRPAMSLRTEIIAMRDLPAGAPVGYGYTFRATRPVRIATVPLGYADGFMRSNSNRGAMLVRGQRCAVAGTVSMDLTMLDVTDVFGCQVGDEVVLLGEQGGERISVNDLAASAGTIGYEVLTNISRRVPRVYSLSTWS